MKPPKSPSKSRRAAKDGTTFKHGRSITGGEGGEKKKLKEKKRWSVGHSGRRGGSKGTPPSVEKKTKRGKG